MAVELYLAFVAATLVLLLIPGPTVLLVVGYALSGGRRTVAYTAPGVALGDATAMTVSLLGLGALLATSATAFTIVKWVGAAYLVWLGIGMWRTRPATDAMAPKATSRTGAAMLRDAWLVTALNPKSVVFFMAFLPQFVRPDDPYLPQVLLLGGTFVLLATINAALFGALAGSARGAVRSPIVQLWVNRTGGSLLIGAGVVTAALKRA